MQSKIGIFNIDVYGKIGTNMEYNTSDALTDIRSKVYMLKHKEWHKFCANISIRSTQTKIRIFNINVYRKIGTGGEYCTSYACYRVKTLDLRYMSKNIKNNTNSTLKFILKLCEPCAEFSY